MSMFSTTFFDQKVTAVFVRELSGLWCIYYHIIYTQKLSGGAGGEGVAFNNLFPPSRSYHGVCI